MVVCSIETIQLEYLHAPVPLTRAQAQSLINDGSPDRSEKKRKRKVNRHKSLPERPPFTYYASSYVDPYVDLTPFIIGYKRHPRGKVRKPSKRREKKTSDIDDRSPSPLPNDDPIDLWPSNSNLFNMELIRQRQIAIDNYSLHEIIDSWKVDSLDQLLVLMEPLAADQNSIDRLAMIFYWICRNIRYDLSNENVDRTDVEKIIQTKKSTCEGYANLFQSLCDHLQIRCVKIVGYVKDHHYRLNQEQFLSPNHTWNAVELIPNYWYLIDSAWASGYINDRHQFIDELQWFYFLVRPEFLIYNHLPVDSRYQWLTNPISMLDFIRLPFLHTAYFTHQLTLISPQFSSQLTFDGKQSKIELFLQAPNDVQLVCRLKGDSEQSTLTQYDASRHLWQCLIAPRQFAFQTLMIFVSRSNSFVKAIELGVDVPSKDVLTKKFFPMTFGKFHEYRCQIFSPLNGSLKSGTHVTIHCRIPHAFCARIAVDDQWLDEVLLKNQIFKQKIPVPKREVIVYAQFNTKRSNEAIYDGLIRYFVHH